MKAIIALAFLLAFQVSAFADNSPIVVTPFGAASMEIFQSVNDHPGEKWMSRKFRIKNNSGRKFHVYGTSLDHVFIEIETKDPQSGKWVSRPTGFCETGASPFPVPQDSEFTVTVRLPMEISDRDFKIGFTRNFGLGSQAAREKTCSEPLSMKSKS